MDGRDHERSDAKTNRRDLPNDINAFNDGRRRSEAFLPVFSPSLISKSKVVCRIVIFGRTHIRFGLDFT